jgi:hypothetical protein
MISAQRSPVRSSSDAIVFRSTLVMRLMDRMELPSTSAEITASFFSAERVFILSLTFLVKASQNELEDWHFGLPDCWF